MSQYAPKFDTKIFIFLAPVILPDILKSIWCSNIIPMDYESVWPVTGQLYIDIYVRISFGGHSFGYLLF